MLHLLGYHDVYRSHHPVNIFWGSFVSYIYRTFRELDPKRTAEDEAPLVTDGEDGLLNTWNQENAWDKNVTLAFNQHGKIYRRLQVEDYVYRGAVVNSYNLLDYFVDTYEQAATRSQAKGSTIMEDTGLPSDNGPHKGASGQGNTRGRPTHGRVDYLQAHPRSKTHTRVIRPDSHNHMPNIIGPRFPQKTDPAQADLYAACILVFLKPWRKPNDIKEPNQSWSDALTNFLSTASDRVLDIIDNIEHGHKARAVAEEDQQAYFDQEDIMNQDRNNMQVDEIERGMESNKVYCVADHYVTEEMIERAALELENHREIVHGVQASDLRMLKSWRTLLKQDAEAIRCSHGSTNPQGTSASNDNGTVEVLTFDNNANNVSDMQDELLLAPFNPAELIPHAELFPDQQRAFGIFRWHLMRMLYAQEHGLTNKPPQLCLLMIGEGGTGKSRVIQTITEEFRRLGIEDRLMKAAFT
ncbi:hypothetical protein FRC09_011781, partial [Ceratobasidium sp. 395]